MHWIFSDGAYVKHTIEGVMQSVLNQINLFCSTLTIPYKIYWTVMFLLRNSFRMLALIGAAALAACGGGGGGSDAPPAVTSFQLLKGFQARAAGAQTEKFSISGTCSGTLNSTQAGAVAGTFEGAPVMSKTVTATLNFTNCTPASSASTTVGYYDSNYSLLGHSTQNVEYGKFLTVPALLPTSVKIGDTAVYGTETIYADSTKTTLKGQRTLSYVIEADVGSTQTAVANLITRDFNTANQLLYTQQSRFRLAADGTLTPISQDLQFSTTSSNHLVLTAVP